MWSQQPLWITNKIDQLNKGFFLGSYSDKSHIVMFIVKYMNALMILRNLICSSHVFRNFILFVEINSPNWYYKATPIENRKLFSTITSPLWIHGKTNIQERTTTIIIPPSYINVSVCRADAMKHHVAWSCNRQKLPSYINWTSASNVPCYYKKCTWK